MACSGNPIGCRFLIQPSWPAPPVRRKERLMPSSHHTHELTTVNPLAAPTELIGWLASTTLHILIGLAGGMLAARLIRHRRLHWTWAAVALVPLVLIRGALPGWTLTLDTAALCAAVRGRHWHREDLIAGGDLAEAASERCGPLKTARRLANVALERHRPPALALRQDRVCVGRTLDRERVSIPLGVIDGGRHTLIVGATGSGKTVTEAWLASRAVDAGMAAVVLDPKGDPHMREQLVEAARRSGRPFLEWTPRGPSVYNPLGHGAASEIADKALAGERFTEPHYQRQAQRYLGHAVRALRYAGETVSLRGLVQLLEPARLELLSRSLPEHRSRVTCEYLGSLTPRACADLGGVRDRLAILAESDVAPWLDPATPGVPIFDLLGAIRQRAVVYFALEADAWPLLAHMLGAAIVQDLQTTMAALQSSPVPAVVVIDEFAAISCERVVNLFGRARSAGINLLLGTQELSDLRVDGHRQLLEQVLGNLSSLIAHRQVVPESAELVSRLGGSRGVWRTSHTDSGRWTRTRARAPQLPPEKIRALPPGWAAAIELGGGSPLRVIQVFSSTTPQSREPVLARLRSRLAAQE
jgi:TraM recognition site of TraD and TraG/Helicase HerA, central domain